ncbi:MAG: histidine kinase, partial [Treponemataceae bacterium]
SRELSVINRASLEQLRDAVETVIRETDSVAVGLSTDAEFSSMAKQTLTKRLETIQDVRARSAFQGTLKSASNVRPYLRSVYVYIDSSFGLIGTSADDVVSRKSFYDTEWIDDGLIHRSELGYRIIPRTVEPYPGLRLRYRYFTLFRNILSAGTFEYNGILALNIDVAYFEQLMATHLREGYGKVQLLDNAENVLAEAGGPPAGDRMKTSFVEYNTVLNQYPFVLKAMIPRVEYYRLPLTLALISALSSLTALVLGLGAAYGLSRRSFRSIAAIIDIIQAANRGDPLPEPSIPLRNGYHDLVYSILKTFVERRFLKLQLSERELREKTLELLALQSQMNPHFLFNTLTSISCGALAFTNGPNTVTEMIEHLAHLLEYSLGNPEREVTMEDELVYAEHYVAIQSHRYKDTFSVEWRIDPHVRPLEATRLLLQPLIENAIYHGIRNAAGRRRIIVEAGLKDDAVLIQVSDDGIGMSPARLAEVRSWVDKPEHQGGHIGLFNTVRRLTLRYGDAAEVSIESEEGKGASVTLLFPARKSAAA